MKQSNQLSYTLWAAAIIVCLLLSVFALFFTSCAKQDAADAPAAESGFTIESAVPDGGDAPEDGTE